MTTTIDRPVETVTIPRAELAQLRVAATSWWRFWETGAFTDVVDREIAARIKQTSVDISGARHTWLVGPAHAELERRRYPWLSDPDWTPPMLTHRSGRYDGGPVDWTTGEPA